MIESDIFERDDSWDFSNCGKTETVEFTHGYCAYPAKFIPQIPRRLITEHSGEGDLVADVFMGSGTTAVEALLQKRKFVGVDANPYATLVSTAKTFAFERSFLEEIWFDLIKNIVGEICAKKEKWAEKINSEFPFEKAFYWHDFSTIIDLLIILSKIREITNENAKKFFLVCFAGTLKRCSFWSDRTNKPLRDLNKTPQKATIVFEKQFQKMLKGNDAFYEVLDKTILKNIDEYRKLFTGNAKNVSFINDESASLIVTSPPYGISYEYAHLHELPLSWLSALGELPKLKLELIGSLNSDGNSLEEIENDKILKICNNINAPKKRKAIIKYFSDMNKVFKEMKRILKKKGHVGMVIGDATIEGILIPISEIFVEEMQKIGFEKKVAIERRVLSKFLPTFRNLKTGRFSKKTDENSSEVYGKERILIMQKKK